MNWIWLLALLAIVIGGGVYVVLSSVRRRRRIWFAGESGNQLVALTERRALVLREMRDLELAYLAGRLPKELYESRIDSNTAEALELSRSLDVIRKRRATLEAEAAKLAQSSKQSSALALLVAMLACIGASVGAAQGTRDPDLSRLEAPPAAVGSPIWPSPRTLPQVGVLRLELRDPAQTLTTFQDAVAVVGMLPSDSIPFDELTQGAWTAAFDRLLDPHKSLPSEEEMALGVGGIKMSGFPVNVPPSGRLEINELPAYTRIVVAVLHGDVWWPCRREFMFFEDFQQQTAVIDVYALSTDMSQLECEEWQIEASLRRVEGDLRWIPVDLDETITITNPSRTHAVIGHQALRKGDWMVIPLTPPPGISPSELSGGLLIGTWRYFVGVESAAPIKFAGTDHIKPYHPWSWGLDWDGAGGAHGMGGNPHGDPHGSPHGNPHGDPHGGGLVPRGWQVPGAKHSGDETHPLNYDGRFEFIGGGAVHLRLVENDNIEMLCLVINKPIPPSSRMVIRIAQQPGLLIEDPAPIRVYRAELPFPIMDLRALAGEGLELKAGSGFRFEMAGDARPLPDGGKQQLWVGKGESENGVVIPDGRVLAYDVMPSGALRKAIELINKEHTEKEQKANAAALAAANPPNVVEEDTTVATLWLIAGLLGIATLVAAVIAMRGTTQEQLAKLAQPSFSVREGLSEIAELEREYRAGRMSAAVYRDERNRILNRLAAPDESA